MCISTTAVCQSPPLLVKQVVVRVASAPCRPMSTAPSNLHQASEQVSRMKPKCVMPGVVAVFNDFHKSGYRPDGYLQSTAAKYVAAKIHASSWAGFQNPVSRETWSFIRRNDTRSPKPRLRRDVILGRLPGIPLFELSQKGQQFSADSLLEGRAQE
jgi:hypothetical protein